MEGTLAEVRMYAGNVLPSGWEYCHGQTLPIAGNAALYSLLDTTFGGDGIIDFGLPDLRGRVVLGAGTGGSWPAIQVGEADGTNTATLSTTNMPTHNHALTGSVTVQAATDGAIRTDPTNNYLGPASIYGAAIDLTNMAPAVVTLQTVNAGSGTPFSLLQPYLGLQYIICIRGPYPSLL